ncbi:MAG: hypothetical protein FWG98_08635 [Candidatus Cloacimonetes bacterium]|nr:hypothetical protein [Candidatus Cloacimonadota bacterium]
MTNNKYHRNTSKMLSFNRNVVHHHENTLKGLSLFKDPLFQGGNGFIDIFSIKR